MPVAVSLAAVPRVLDEDEVPFVIGIGSDPRRALVTPEVEYRRAGDRCSIEYPYGGGKLRLRALMMASGGACFVSACAGPFLNDWWPLLRSHPPDPGRPVLSAAAAGRNVTMLYGDTPVNLTLTPATDSWPMTMAVIGVGQGLTDENLALSKALGLFVIKVALLALSEYHTLLDPVPDVKIDVSGTAVPLATLLDAAAEAAEAIEWQLAPA